MARNQFLIGIVDDRARATRVAPSICSTMELASHAAPRSGWPTAYSRCERRPSWAITAPVAASASMPNPHRVRPDLPAGQQITAEWARCMPPIHLVSRCVHDMIEAAGGARRGTAAAPGHGGATVGTRRQRLRPWTCPRRCGRSHHDRALLDRQRDAVEGAHGGSILACRIDLAQVTPGPHAQILEAEKPIAAKKGLDIVELSDYVVPNAALDAGELQANSFQILPYLDNQKADRRYKIEPVGLTVNFPLGIYSKKFKSWDEIPAGSTIAIQNDPTNGGRSLLLLQDKGALKLKPNVGTSRPSPISSRTRAGSRSSRSRPRRRRAPSTMSPRPPSTRTTPPRPGSIRPRMPSCAKTRRART